MKNIIACMLFCISTQVSAAPVYQDGVIKPGETDEINSGNTDLSNISSSSNTPKSGTLAIPVKEISSEKISGEKEDAKETVTTARTTIPEEPGSLALLGIGLAGMLFFRRKKKENIRLS